MSAPRLTSDFWVKVHIRTLAAHDVPAFVVRRGDPTAGQILVKVNMLSPFNEPGTSVMVPATATDGARAWRAGTGPDPVTDVEAEAYLARQTGFDPDLWIVEIEGSVYELYAWTCDGGCEASPG